MMRKFADLISLAQSGKKVNLCVAAAQDESVLEAVKQAQAMGLIKPVLVGNKEMIRKIMKDIHYEAKVLIIDCDSDELAAQKAVRLIADGECDILMKGLINSNEFLKAVLEKDSGMRKTKILSTLAAFDIPSEKKMIFVTDGGMVIAPTLEEKKELLINAMLALHALGIEKPKVAVLAANEKVNPKMQSTVDAKGLTEMSASGLLPEGIVEGPMAFDVAVDKSAAVHKGIKSEVSGDVDLLLVPNIDTGNAVGKAMMYYGKGNMAGIVLGAAKPVIIPSRTETAQGKLVSIVMAMLVSKNIEEKTKEYCKKIAFK